MAEIRPFRAYRPAPGKESVIAALPYDVYSRQEARAYVEEHPESFLAIDRPETQFPEGSDIYDPQVYKKARQMLDEKIEKGDFIQEEKPVYYLYEETFRGRSQIGIVGCASIDDYMNGVIKKHENTVEVKEQDRIHHVDACDAQTGPIFLAYRDHEDINALTDRIRKGTPLYDFVFQNEIGNRVWIIDRPEDIEMIHKAFSEIESIYIADGHHRCASAVKAGLKRRAEHPGYTGEEEYNFFLSVLFPASELEILDYNRVVKDLGGLDKSEVLLSVKRHFSCVPYHKTQAKPQERGEIGMYLGKNWYLLSAKNGVKSGDPVDGLDVSILQHNVLGPLFHISDPRTDPRIEFVGGIRGLSELEKRADAYGGVAFAMYPVRITDLFAVADAGKLMPPKTTWFEPKLLSGLFIHKMS